MSSGDIATGCEDIKLIHAQDYYVTIYSAEIVNTLTNLLFMYLAYKGLTNCYRNGHDRVFSVAFVGYFVVGFGSFLFHTTLSCEWHRSRSPSRIGGLTGYRTTPRSHATRR